MAEKILKQNKIPGCERLTRPEEIKALSKYLRNIKETLEENTDLEETTLEVPGKTTGQLYDISELPQGKEILDPNHTIEALETERLDLEDKRTPDLSTYREGLDDKRDIALSDYRDNLEDNRKPELSEYKDNLTDEREPELSDYKDSLEDTREPKLSDIREDLEDLRDIALSDYKDELEDNREQELSDYRDNLTDEREPELSDYKDSLEDTREPKLSDYQDKIEDNRDIALSDYKDIIEDERDPKLSDYRETISDIPESELPDTAEKLEGESRVISSLPDYKDTLTDESEPKLSNYKDELSDERKPELGNTRIDIFDDRDPSLSDVRLDIQDDRNPELSDTRLDILDERENSLSDYQESFAGEVNEVESLYDAVIGLDDSREPELEDYKDTIVDDREPELSDYKDELSDEREPELEDYKDTIVDDREPELSDYKDELSDEREPELEDYKDELTDEREPELSDTIIERPDNNEEEARVDGVFPNNEWNDDGSPGYYGSFDNVIPKLVDDREPELEDTVIKKEAVYNPETGTFSTDGVARTDGEYDYVDNSLDYNDANPIIQQKAKDKFERHQVLVDRPGNSEEDARTDGVFSNDEWNDDGSPGYYGSFDNVIPKLVDDREPELSDVIIGAKENENPNSLYETLANLSEGDLYNFVLQLYNEREHDSDLEIDSEWKEKISGLISAFLSPDDPNYKEVTKPISPRNAHRFEDELFRSIRLIDDEEEIEGSLSRNSDGTGRIDGDYDFIDGTNTTKSQVKKHTEDDYKDVPISEMPQDSTELMIEYIRYLAEQSVGIVNNRTLRKYLLDEALWTLILTRRIGEKEAKINRDRLPGHSIQGASGFGTLVDEIYQAIQDGNIITTTTNFISRYIKEKPNPINRPERNSATGKKQDTYYFTSANSRYSKNQNEGNAGVFKNLWNRVVSNLSGERPLGDDNYYFFSDNYLSGGGIRTTLKDLCDSFPDKPSEWSVEDLMDTLKNSPYITTPSKFGTIHEGSYGTQTLDSNSYWEVIIEPLCDDYLNGGYSYLPCFNEINVINAAVHGVSTAYNKWVPISNFELQKSKLTTKSIGLYDGEFSFPISAELTNEIRFTIVDDQYKSWRNYFQKCMDVAVYNSEPHKKSYYEEELPFLSEYFTLGGAEELSGIVTPVDKSIITVAFYKNITFRIRIYIMTPQYSTIRRFDLLCVLKDFAEEYSGDIDSGGIDLNVTFSIVGENPNGADQEKIGDRDWLIGLVNREFNGEVESELIPSLLPRPNLNPDYNIPNIFGG